ncbi:hypothetical protein BJ546DRAFT_984103 [Cryomyces antarcticus]
MDELLLLCFSSLLAPHAHAVRPGPLRASLRFSATSQFSPRAIEASSLAGHVTSRQTTTSGRNPHFASGAANGLLHRPALLLLLLLSLRGRARPRMQRDVRKSGLPSPIGQCYLIYGAHMQKLLPPSSLVLHTTVPCRHSCAQVALASSEHLVRVSSLR